TRSRWIRIIPLPQPSSVLRNDCRDPGAWGRKSIARALYLTYPPGIPYVCLHPPSAPARDLLPEPVVLRACSPGKHPLRRASSEISRMLEPPTREGLRRAIPILP